MSSFSKIKHKTYDSSKGYGDPDKWKSAFSDRMQISEKEEQQEENPFAACQSRYDVKTIYRSKAMEVHPDRGGKQEDFIKLERQYKKALSHFK